LIEYHGQQHYEFVPHFHKTHDQFIERQKYDKHKETLAKDSGHNLLVILYTELKNIDSILKEGLSL